MTPLVQLIATAREPRTAAELWHEVVTLRNCGLAVPEFPASKSELERMLRMQKFAGRVAEEVGEDGIVRWVVVKQVREAQKALFG